MSPTSKKKEESVVESPKPEKPKAEFEKGKLIADILIVGIKPESARPIHYRVAARKWPGENAPFKKRPVVKDQNVVLVPVWEDQVHCMTEDDFRKMVTARLASGHIIQSVEELGNLEELLASQFER